MPLDFTASVLRNTDLGHKNYLLEFSLPEAAGDMTPAQFFMIGIPGVETLLRRPYSACGLPGTFDGRPDRAVQVLYKVVGRGTSLLGSLRQGANIEVLGPLGRGFGRPARPDTRPVFVAGGIGAAPFPALAAALQDSAPRPR
jgi:dihydroorotate dehydrogenase electron transfer subunit